MANYTRGEWKVYTDSMTCATDIVAEDGLGFFTEVIAHIRRANKHYEANAHLIAAAPKMAEALKFFINRNTSEYVSLDRGIGISTEVGKAFLDAREAFTKAEGKGG